MTPRTPHPRTVRTLLAVAAVVALAGTGCARSGPSGVRGGPTTSAGSTSRSASPPVSPSASPGPVSPTSPAASGGVLTLDGVARKGVEPGCTVFDAGDHGLYLLLGAGGGTPDQKSIPLGVPLRVHGVLVDQFVSYCQQGRPMEIVDIARR